MRYDAIVVGGGFAGLSASLQLGRARRRVLVLDAGKPRNRFARTAHGFLGHDGKPPETIVMEALRQLRAYPTVDLVHEVAEAAEGQADGFVVTLSSGEQARGRRLVLATGVNDDLPPLPGLAERWGETVLHCPYCHGFEVRDRPLGVLAAHPAAAHQAAMLPDWGPTTLFTQGAFEPSEEEAARLAVRGVAIERTPVVELLGPAPQLEGVRLADGRTMRVQALFTAPKTAAASPLAEQLGCAFEDGMTGPHVKVDELKQTSVGGVFAAGDVATGMHNATLAAAAGVMAGIAAHRSLVFET